jgi:iron complex outermembrane receptor protein
MNTNLNSIIKKGISVSLLAFAIAGSGYVQAQALEEIIVTATKRNTSLQDTPLAISAISSDMLQREDIRDFNQFAGKIPGLNLQEVGPGRTKIIIRGVASTIGEATTSVYYDEIPINGGPGTGGDSGNFEPAVNFFDVERVEVLRGPQGTLYGGGSMGGTVRIIYNKPDHEGFSGRVESGVSSIKSGGIGYNASGVVNVPLIEDTLAARFLGYYRDSGGYIDNITMDMKDVNANKTYGGKFMLKYDPMDGVSLLGTLIMQRSNMNSSNQFHPDANAGLVTTHGVVEHMDDSLNLFNLTGNFEIGDWADLVVTASHFKRDLKRDFSADPTEAFSSGFLGFVGCARANGIPPGSCTPAQSAAWIVANEPYQNGKGGQPMDMNMDSYEARLTSNWDSAWNYTVGVFIQKRDYFQLSRVYGNAADGEPRNPIVPATAFRSDTFEHTEQLSFFGEVSYDMTEQLTLTAGARHFDIDRDNGGFNVIGYAPFGTVLGPVNPGMANDKDFNFKGHIGYQYNEDILLYAQVAEGFRSGGANRLINPLLPESFESDSLVNYEIGAKTSWLDNRLVLNGSIYKIVWSDMQTAADDPNLPVSFTGNAGEATIDGVELELAAYPSSIEGLSITGNISYQYARLTEDQITPIAIANGRKGDDIPLVPEWTAGISMEYVRPFSDNMDGFARVDFNWRDETQSHFNEGGNFQVFDDYTTTAIRAGVDKGDDWGVDVYVSNLFNDDPILSGVRSNFTKPGFHTQGTLQPRTIGMSMHMNY